MSGRSFTPGVTAQLGELCAMFAASETELLELLVGREYARCHALRNASCPWDIAPGVAEALALLLAEMPDPPPHDVDSARWAIETAAVEARQAEDAGRRCGVLMEDGLLRFRGAKPRRLLLYVDASGPRRCVVSVELHERELRQRAGKAARRG